jgi:hypothetical protein
MRGCAMPNDEKGYLGMLMRDRGLYLMLNAILDRLVRGEPTL